MYEAPDGTFPPCPEIFGKLFYIHPGLDYLYPMTDPQHTLLRKMLYVIERIENPLSCMEEAILKEMLAGLNPNDSIGHLSIVTAIHNDEEGDHYPVLLKNLADQCMDDPFTMASIVGKDGLVLILRSQVAQKRPIAAWWQRVQVWILRKF